MPATRPVCFVIMPFGVKKDPGGGPDIDFNRIYDAVWRGIEDAGMEPVRGDAERTGGIIHKPMFERLLLCDYAVADLTTANANVFYELGVRHAARTATTLPIFAKQHSLPFDVNFLRALPYELADGNAFGETEAAALRSAIAKRLAELRSVAHETATPDSPVFQLLEDYPAPEISRLKTDLFREQLEATAAIQKHLEAARAGKDGDRMKEIGAALDPKQTEAGVIVDLFLSFRAVSMWDEMIALYDRMPAELKRAVMVREQLGFAQNRLGEHSQAIDTLEQVVEEHGASSETCGILGRVFKDLWARAKAAGDALSADGYLAKAIETYERGFCADWRDAYPGINAVTLLELQGNTERRDELLPVVQFSARQRLGSKPDYWDHATLLELAVLGREQEAARKYLSDAIISVREPWEPETTANNLKLIRGARQERGVAEPWLNEIIAALERRSS
jgi:tetratricopeptide (TPR) repeat protein